MSKKRTADVTISLYWDSVWKKWGLTITGPGTTRSLTIRSTDSIGDTEMYLLAHALRREVESWLPMQG